MKECLKSDCGESESEDKNDQGEEDDVETGVHDKDREQNLSETEDDQELQSDPFCVGKDKTTRWKKHCPREIVSGSRSALDIW